MVAHEGESMNYYAYTFMAECPSDGDQVMYTIEIETSEFIKAEDIRENCDRGAVYHEELADDLSRLMPGNQRLTATHRSVKIITTRNRGGA